MDDLISRQAAIDAIEHRLAEPAYQHEGEDWYTGMNCAESELYDLPPAQHEIIRCKDCKWYGRVDKRRFYRGMDCLQKHIDTIVPDRDFCSKAERRGEQDG